MKQETGYLIADTNDIQGTRGWIFGHFMEGKGLPDLSSKEVEMAIMDLPLEDKSLPHYHLKGTEITYVISGKLTLNLSHLDTPDKVENVEVSAGEFFIVRPRAVLQNPKNELGTRVIVVKFPSVPEDKFYITS